jgi:hypothetical protein
VNFSVPSICAGHGMPCPYETVGASAARGKKEVIPLAGENWYASAHVFGSNFPEKSGDDEDSSVNSMGRLRGSADRDSGVGWSDDRTRAGSSGSRKHVHHSGNARAAPECSARADQHVERIRAPESAGREFELEQSSAKRNLRADHGKPTGGMGAEEYG